MPLMVLAPTVTAWSSTEPRVGKVADADVMGVLGDSIAVDLGRQGIAVGVAGVGIDVVRIDRETGGLDVACFDARRAFERFHQAGHGRRCSASSASRAVAPSVHDSQEGGTKAVSGAAVTSAAGRRCESVPAMSSAGKTGAVSAVERQGDENGKCGALLAPINRGGADGPSQWGWYCGDAERGLNRSSGRTLTSFDASEAAILG